MTRCCGVGIGFGVGEGAESGEEFADPGFFGLGFVGLEGSVLEVGARGLESVEDESGLALVEATVEESVESLHEGDLNRVGILQHGELDDMVARIDAALALGRGALTFAGFVVEVAEAPVAKRRATAANSVYLNMLASWY